MPIDDRSQVIAEMAAARQPQAPGDDLSSGLRESNAALERRWANRPVLSGTPRPSPDDTYGDPGSGLTIPTQGQRAPTSSVDDLPSPLGPLDLINNAMRPDSVSARSYRAAAGLADPDYRGPVIGVDGPQPTPPSSVEEAYQDPSRSLDVQSGPVITSQATRPRANSFSGVGTAVEEGTIAAANRAARREMDAMDARANQDQREVWDRNRAGNDLAQARYDKATAENNARISGFRATNGADVVLAPENKGYDQQRALIGARAAEDARRVIGASGDVAAANARFPRANDRNMIGEAQTAGEIINRGAISEGEAQQRIIGGQIEKQKLEQQRRLNTLGNVLATSKDAGERARASEALLALMGKDKPEEYTVTHMSGGSRLADPSNPLSSIVKEADRVVITNKRTGTHESIQLGTNEPAQGGDPVAEAKAAVARGANKDQVNARLKAMGYKGI